MPTTPFKLLEDDYGIAPFTGASLTDNLSHYGLGTASLQPVAGTYDMTTNSGSNVMVLMGEWDDDYQYIPVGMADGVPPTFVRDARDCYDIDGPQGCPGSPPTSAAAGFNDLVGYLHDHMPVMGTDGLPSNGIVSSVPGLSFYDHYAAWMSSNPQIIGHENGADTGNWQAHLAFARGAARQFNWEWLMDYSSWYGQNCRSTIPIGTSCCPCCGHSDLMAKRHHYLAWIGGANYLHDEGGSFSYFQTGTTDGYFDLSNAGRIMQTLEGLASSTDRGTPFVPIGVVLNYDHGMGRAFSSPSPAIWDSIPITYESQDWYSYNLFNQVLWPNGFLSETPPETQNIVNTPLGFGDAIDVVLENAAPSVLGQFQVLLLTGNISFSPSFISNVNTFLQSGKTVILGPGLSSNASLFAPGTSQLDAPTDFGALTQTLAAAYSSLAPFVVTTGAVSYQIAVQGNGSYLLALYNNLGVDKAWSSTTCETVDHGYDTPVTIDHAPSDAFASVTLLEGEYAPSWSAGQITVVVPAGDVTLLQIATRPTP